MLKIKPVGSYTWLGGAGRCRLSGDDTVSAVGGLEYRAGAEHYQRGPCLQCESCGRQTRQAAGSRQHARQARQASTQQQHKGEGTHYKHSAHADMR